MAGKTFRFSLQKVLDLRARQAEEAERTLSRAVRARREQEERVAAIRARRRAACDDASSAPAGATLGPATLRRRAGHFAARRRPEEALRVLRDQEARAHRMARDKAELEFLDEQATSAHVRKQITAQAA